MPLGSLLMNGLEPSHNSVGRGFNFCPTLKASKLTRLKKPRLKGLHELLRLGTRCKPKALHLVAGQNFQQCFA